MLGERDGHTSTTRGGPSAVGYGEAEQAQPARVQSRRRARSAGEGPRFAPVAALSTAPAGAPSPAPPTGAQSQLSACPRAAAAPFSGSGGGSPARAHNPSFAGSTPAAATISDDAGEAGPPNASRPPERQRHGLPSRPRQSVSSTRLRAVSAPLPPRDPRAVQNLIGVPR